MKDIYTRNRLLKWSIIILFILNLALLASIWYPRLIPAKKKTLEPTKLGKQNRIETSERLVGFLKKELNLSREQVDKFRQLLKEHSQKMDQLERQIDNLKKEIMDHLLESKPDTTEMEKLANKIGQKISEHEKQGFNHFLDVMELCNSDQKQKYRTLLRDIIYRVYPQEGPPFPPGGGMDKLELREPPDHGHRPGGKGGLVLRFSQRKLVNTYESLKRTCKSN